MPRPEISVVIPAYSYPAGLDRALAALAKQLRAPEFEVLVVDDGSPETLEPVADAYRDRLNIRYLRLTNGGPARARNAGARAAGGELLAFLDHDCEPAPDWLAHMARESERSGMAAIGGSKVTGLSGNYWSVAHDVLTIFASNWNSDDSAFYLPSENLAVPRSRFIEVGGFNEGFQYAHEDREFGTRWREQGNEMRRAPEAVVRHSHAFTLRSFCRQHFRYGQGAAEFYLIRKKAGPAWPLSVRLRFYGGLLASPWKTLKYMTAARVSAILVLSQVCYAYGYYSMVARFRSEGTVAQD